MIGNALLGLNQAHFTGQHMSCVVEGGYRVFSPVLNGATRTMASRMTRSAPGSNSSTGHSGLQRVQVLQVEQNDALVSPGERLELWREPGGA